MQNLDKDHHKLARTIPGVETRVWDPIGIQYVTLPHFSERVQEVSSLRDKG